MKSRGGLKRGTLDKPEVRCLLPTLVLERPTIEHPVRRDHVGASSKTGHSGRNHCRKRKERADVNDVVVPNVFDQPAAQGPGPGIPARRLPRKVVDAYTAFANQLP